MFVNILFSYLTIPVGLLKCMLAKRVAHKRSEVVLPFKVAWIAAGPRDSEIMYRHAQALPWGFSS
jgi:hypothetical protein